MRAGRALIVAPRPPEFDRESGLLRIAHLIDMLLDRGWEVAFGCVRTLIEPERYRRHLEQRGVETHIPLASVDDLRDPAGIDLAILAYWHVAERFLPELRSAAPRARIVVDSVDLHFLRAIRDKLRADPDSAPGQLTAGLADELIRELNAYAASDAVLTVSQKEAALVNDFASRGDLALALPDVEELPRSEVPPRRRRGIVFLGNFMHAPNRDAAAYLCQEILPRVDESLLSEHPVSVVGTGAEEHMRELAGGLAHVTTVGWVPSVVPYLAAARMSVVPLRYGAGTKRKIIQSLMVGTPTVTTSVGAEGLGLRDRREALIADDPGAFAQAIETLLRHPLTWRGLARRGRRHALRLHGRATVESRLDAVLEDVLRRTPRPAVAEPAEERGATVGGDGVVRSPAYARLVSRIVEMMARELPGGARPLVVTRGDDGLLDVPGRRGWHFPRGRDGGYAGYYPRDSAVAIRHLEELREQGATHFVLPEPAFWWLEHYAELREHLDRIGRRTHDDEDLIIYELGGERPEPKAQAGSPAAERGEDGARAAEPAAAEEDGARAAERAAPGSGALAEVIERLRPATLAAASRYRSEPGLRALVLGVYLAGKPNTAEHIAATLAGSERVEVRQRWVALGGEAANGALGDVTALAIGEPASKYALLNRLLAAEDLDGYDYVITTDDDIVLPESFLDLFLGVQAALGFDLAQPARTPNSHVDHPIVIQQRGVLARRTLFVEIGPLVSFGREIFDLVLPFDESNPMGWGFENVWSRLLSERGRAQGIVDAVPVDHSIREPVAHYEWADAVADRERYLAAHPHLPLEECFRVLDVVGVEG